MRLETPERVRDLQRGLYLKAKREPTIGLLACLEVKMIGKPYAGKMHVRFDEGGPADGLWPALIGHDAGNGGYNQGMA